MARQETYEQLLKLGYSPEEAWEAISEMDWDKMASEIVSRFEEEELTIKDAMNVLDLVVIKIEASKVSSQKA